MIIFAGFVVYLIWGLVFDFTIEAHEKKDKVRLAIKHKEEEIKVIEQNIEKLNLDINALEEKENKIQDIYKKILQGENFEDLAKQFSEDTSSSSKGGLLNRFGSGQLSSEEFENAAFSLTKENPISAPFQSKYGWHIVKLIETTPYSIRPSATRKNCSTSASRNTGSN